jgi:PAS domain S-box-containing protein
MSDSNAPESSSESLAEKLVRAVQRGQSMDRVASALQAEDLMRSLSQVSADQSIEARLRLATLNLMQDAIAARRAEQEQASERALAQAAYQERDTQLQLALEVAAIGTFSWDLALMRCEPDERMRSLCGWADEPGRHFMSLAALMVAVDQSAFNAAIIDALRPEGNGQLKGDFCLRRPDQEERWLAITAVVEFAESPRRGTQMRGAVLDVTERKRSENALRVSEQRFRQFSSASSDVLWIRDAASLRLEFVSSAFEQIFGANATRVQLRGIEEWAVLIVPDDRGTALRNISSVQQGNPIVEEFRIQRPSDGTFRWIHSTAFPLRDDYGRVQRIAGISRDITDTKQLIEHQAILVAELQHRVRNIMAMIRAIASRMAETSRDVEHYADALIGRLNALARTQSMLTRAGNAGVDVRAIVTTEISAQALSDQFELVGPSVALSPKAAEVLTLVVHELTTNALKYGAFATEEGRLRVEWQVTKRSGQPWIKFHWRECCEADPPGPKGFGSELIEQRVPYELKGTGQLLISAGGADCHLQFPLNAGGSILETYSPSLTRVHGGSIDMHGAPKLENLRVLLVEDDYYLAGDAERALRGAGALVEGPYPSQSQAEDALARQRPDCAMIDINLGSGPSFELAKRLRLHQVPFVFLTGYDQDVIPLEFSDVTCLHKPIEFGDLVQSIAELMQRAA